MPQPHKKLEKSERVEQGNRIKPSCMLDDSPSDSLMHLQHLPMKKTLMPCRSNIFETIWAPFFRDFQITRCSHSAIKPKLANLPNAKIFKNILIRIPKISCHLQSLCLYICASCSDEHSGEKASVTKVLCFNFIL